MPEGIDIQTIVRVAQDAITNKNSSPEIKTIDGIECLVQKGGNAPMPLQLPERYLSNPRRVRAKVSLYEALSFILYVNAHKVDNRTVIFGEADETGGAFVAIIDYHDQARPMFVIGEAKADAAAASTESNDPTKISLPVLAHHGEHVVELKLETRPEWKRWITNDRKLLTQEQFAEFIEENMNDIVDPDAATLLETAQLLQGKKTVSFKGGKNLRTGAIALEYVENIEIAGGGTNRTPGEMQLPDKFKLGLVPFVGGNGVEIEARLRFRITPDGKLMFAYVLNRPFEVIEKAFDVARADIEEQTGLKVLLGNGEITTA